MRLLVPALVIALSVLSSPLAPWRHVRVGRPRPSGSGGGGTGFGLVPFGTAPFGDGAAGATALPLVAFRAGRHRPVRVMAR